MDAETKRQVEQLSVEGWSQRAIAEAVGIGLAGGLLVVAVVFAVVLISLDRLPAPTDAATTDD